MNGIEGPRGQFPDNPAPNSGITVKKIKASEPSRNGGLDNYARNPDALEIARIKLETEKRRYADRHQVTLALIFLGAIAFILVASFTYAAVANDTELPSEVIKDVFVFLGGGGIGTFLSRKESFSE